MTPERFRALAEAGFNRIPVTREVLADLDTPLSTYLKLADEPWTFLLESVQGGEKWGRYSIIGLPSHERIEVRGFTISHVRQGECIERVEVADPLAWIEAFQGRFRVPNLDDQPRFDGGLVGYFGYDTIRYIEPRLRGVEKPDPLGVPDILLMVCDELVVFDNLSGRLTLWTHADPAAADAFATAVARLESLERRLRSAGVQAASPGTGRSAVEEGHFTSGFTEAGFKAAVEKIKEYVLAGDVMQCVPSQRMSIPYRASPLDLYRALRSLNPSPYMFFFNLGDHHVVGSSPEILTRLEDGEVTVRPIAGTRVRGKTEEEDRALEAELLADPKEIAEHLMLIDLGRNDVGRISETGSVQVTDQMAVERYSHVMHIVSNVTGRLKPGLSAMDVLRATFPAGTLSGAPKIRAMEIIDELEPVKRGIYSGAVGYLSWHGNMDTAIAIRTAVIKDGELHVQAGAGVVADSVPEMEWQETLNKGRAIFRAVAMAEKGLDNL
ncbi:anthranilate synthase component I [Halomonas daqingensis]|uniref:Anthranilate synthase component 1 n=1 Tax=Billgrantia desiderata TaxID=52021 RepID=A0AAW4YSP4_9GAMM|nr:anthranilate synthase component I [Halomonas desiderata]MCE8013546.1 anthranilate synthase component I [Halomonas desiderata]MCE8030766.1 anthranilate synthase component I [Halomonas desiderata]MCE8041256.1 anthranilate synthase component I [Halomonas desiderata]MCE8045831.1 anthranilate synthase component I [Halomonas desiderata]MCE8051469.1 anthranilate synthase component I [Halomonas desiderata]